MFDATTDINTITVAEARKRIETTSPGELIVLDVREPKEYAQGHLPGATLMPLSQLPHMMEKLDPVKPVVAYCRSGKRSMAAASILSASGIKDVASMDGGISAWEGLVAVGGPEHGLDLMKGRNTPEDILKLAWAFEDGTRVFYEKVKERLPGPAAGLVLGALIKAEAHHRELILQTFQTFKHDATEEDMKDPEAAGYMEGGTRLENAIAWLEAGDKSPLDIMEICLLIEANALDLYLRLFGTLDSQEAKDALTPIIEEEKTHLKSLGKLLQDLL